MKHKFTVIVGDLHGRLDIAEAVYMAARGLYNIVFVGDYLDSYDRTSAEEFATLNYVHTLAQRFPEDVVGLLGNHELSYFMGKSMRCSGWNVTTDMLVNTRKLDYLRHLKEYVWVNDYLVTHAGIPNYVTDGKAQHEIRETIDEYMLHDRSRYDIGYARGGWADVGGPFWQDFNFEFTPTSGVPQIFGHTHGEGIRRKGDSFCIDCLGSEKKELLVVGPCSAEIVALEDFT